MHGVGPRLTAQGTQGTPARPSNTGARSMTASANASSIADIAGLSTRVRALLAQVKSPRVPFDARSSDFAISFAHEGHFKAEMRGFPTSHLRASPDAVEGNRGHREVSTPSRTAPVVLQLQTASGRLVPVSYRTLPPIRGALLRFSN